MMNRVLTLIGFVSVLACNSIDQSQSSSSKSLTTSTDKCVEDFLNSLCTAEYAPVVCTYPGKTKTYTIEDTNSCQAEVSLRYQTCKDGEELDDKKVTCSPKTES